MGRTAIVKSNECLRFRPSSVHLESDETGVQAGIPRPISTLQPYYTREWLHIRSHAEFSGAQKLISLLHLLSLPRSPGAVTPLGAPMKAKTGPGPRARSSADRSRTSVGIRAPGDRRTKRSKSFRAPRSKSFRTKQALRGRFDSPCFHPGGVYGLAAPLPARPEGRAGGSLSEFLRHQSSSCSAGSAPAQPAAAAPRPRRRPRRYPCRRWRGGRRRARCRR